MMRWSYLPALVLCAAALGPSSAKSEIISQGSWSAVGDSYYSTGMTAQSGAWAGETYSQGMMMADGQFYIQGMSLNPQGGSSGQNYGDTSNGGYGSSYGGYSSGIGSSDTGNLGSNSTGGNSTGGNSTGGNSTGGNSTGGNSTGGNSTGGNSTGGSPGTDAFTNLSFDTSGPGGGSPEDPLTWASSDGYNGGNWNNGGNDDYGSYNPPANDHHSVPEPTTLHLLIAAFLGLALTWGVMPLMPRRGSRCPPGEEISASAV